MEHGGIKSEGWEEKYSDPNDKASTPDNTYAYVIRYNDGTVTVQYYRRGQDGVVRTENTEDPSQKKTWTDQQKTATAQNNAAVTGEGISAPPSQPYVLRAGPKDEAHPDGMYQIPNPNYVPPATGTNAPGKKGTVENGEWVEREIQPDGSQGRITLQRPATQTEKDQAAGVNPADEAKKNKWTEISRKTDKNEQTGQTTVIITERNDLGETRERNASESVTKAPEKPTYREIEGKTYEVKPDGTLVPARIEGQKPGGPIPTIDPSAHLSVIGSAVQAQLQKLYDDPNLTEAQKQQRAQIIVNAGDTFLREQQGLVTTQSNSMTQGITQRGQDLTEAAGRRNTAESIWSTAYQGAMANAKYLPAGSGNTGFNAMLGNMLLAHGSIAAAGGYKNAPQVQPGPALATANAQPLSTAGGSPYTINVNVGAPPTGAPASVQQAVQPPPQPELPVAPGMNFTGGQLRAPGYTAPAEDPMDQFNSYPGIQRMLAA